MVIIFLLRKITFNVKTILKYIKKEYTRRIVNVQRPPNKQLNYLILNLSKLLITTNVSITSVLILKAEVKIERSRTVYNIQIVQKINIKVL